MQKVYYRHTFRNNNLVSVLNIKMAKAFFFFLRKKC